MPYKNPEDKKSWERKDKEKDPEKYKVKSLKDNSSPTHKKAQENWKERNPTHDSEYYRNNKEKVKEATRRRDLCKLGWTPETYEESFKEQRGVCAVCKGPCPTGRRLAADHKHSVPPKPRGLLCVVCNLLIGYARDNPATLRAAAEYLEKF